MPGWMTRFGPKVGQIDPKWDKSGDFSDQIQYIWLERAKFTESDLKKIPGFVPFLVNLTHFGSKSVHPGVCECESSDNLCISFRVVRFWPKVGDSKWLKSYLICSVWTNYPKSAIPGLICPQMATFHSTLYHIWYRTCGFHRQRCILSGNVKIKRAQEIRVVFTRALTFHLLSENERWQNS